MEDHRDFKSSIDNLMRLTNDLQKDSNDTKHNLQELGDDVREIRENMVTKNDIANMAKKGDIAYMATKDDMNGIKDTLNKLIQGQEQQTLLLNELVKRSIVQEAQIQEIRQNK